MNVYVKYEKWIKGKKMCTVKEINKYPHKSVDQGGFIEAGYLHRP